MPSAARADVMRLLEMLKIGVQAPRLGIRPERFLGTIFVSAILLMLIVAPVACLLGEGLSADIGGSRRLTLDFVEQLVTQPIYWKAFLNTVAISAIAALVAVVLGVLLGWLFGRTGDAFRWLERLATLPIFIPPFVGAVAWTLLAAPGIGLINVALAKLGLPGFLDIYTYSGMGWVIGVYLSPYVMMMVASALRSMDPSLEEAARVSGLSARCTAFNITLPLVMPAILSGAVLSFSISIGLFGTPVVLGWSKQILLITSRIWISYQAVPPAYGQMSVLAIFLIALAGVATLVQTLLIGNRSYTTVTGKGFQPRTVELGRWRPVFVAFMWLYIIVSVLAPLGVLVGAMFSTYTWSGKFTFDNVGNILDSDDTWNTLWNSLVLSVSAATLALTLGFSVAWLTTRTRLWGRRFVEALVLLPVSIPGIAFGVGVAVFWLHIPINVYGTMWIMTFALVGRFTSYAVKPLTSALMQIHPELEESARVSGCGWMGTFFRITLPLLRGSAISSWTLLLSIFLTELSMIVLLYTADTRTFSILSFETWNNGDFSTLAGLSILQLMAGGSLMLVVRWLFERHVAEPAAA
jgi:iron(III) transport system permease protein